MNKYKIIYICLFVSFFVLMALGFLKIKHQEEFKQKVVLAQEIHKVLDHLMFDLSEARENTILDVPADGQWHNRLAFDSVQSGALEYAIKDGHLFRTNKGKTILIADNIGDLRIRRNRETPGIVEVQIEAKKNVSLISNLKIRVRQ